MKPNPDSPADYSSNPTELQTEPSAELTVSWKSRTYGVRPGEVLLDALLRQGAEVVFSCRGGSCHACLMRCDPEDQAADLPPGSAGSLPETLRQKAYVLACQFRPSPQPGQSGHHWRLAPPEARDLQIPCTLLSVADGAGKFPRLRFQPTKTFSFQPGDSLRLVISANPDDDIHLLITSDPAEGDWEIEAVLHRQAGTTADQLPDWLQVDASGEVFGHEFEVWRPAAIERQFREDTQVEEAGTPETDPALWHELADGQTVREVLEDFYAQVFQDDRLASFFAGTTPERAIGQQYGFLRQLMTGERVYFGDRPRNAHHWMVISDELMDYRQALMISTLQAHGLTTTQIARWTRLEEHWRRDMVKEAAFPKVQHGLTFALDGFDREVLSCGALCDHCGQEISEGTEVLFHRRMGTISCPNCAPSVQSTP